MKTNLKKNKKVKFKPASAIMLSLFILASVMLIAFGSSSLVLSALKMGGLQSQSSIAYFTAEAGAERILKEIRYYGRGGYEVGEKIFGEEYIDEDRSYTVTYVEYSPIRFISLGVYKNTRRSVEVEF